MASCEKCWADAGGDPGQYAYLVLERNTMNQICSPEEQAGPGATTCPTCQRACVHQHCGVCMNQECEACGKGPVEVKR